MFYLGIFGTCKEIILKDETFSCKIFETDLEEKILRASRNPTISLTIEYFH